MIKKQYLAIASALVLTAGLFPASSDAQVATKNVQAKYNNIKVLYNGSTVSTDIEPFIINGTTYIPLRMMAGVFNKDIAWNGSNYSINVTDRDDAANQAKLAAKDAQIASLQDKIDSLNEKVSDLQDELDDEDNDDDDVDDLISDLEDDLQDEYGDYEGIDWDITVDGNEDNVEVEIAIDLSEFQDEYDDLSDSDLEDLVENVVKDVWNEFEDADVEGTIVDSDDDDNELHDFEGDVDEDDIYFDDSKI